jgi:hypothetical protein
LFIVMVKVAERHLLTTVTSIEESLRPNLSKLLEDDR